MKPQLFIHSSEPCEHLLAPVRNEELRNKPGCGGLWTSTYKKRKSAWVEWCQYNQEDFLAECNWYLLKPKNGLRICTIDTKEDFYNFCRKYFLDTIFYRSFAASIGFIPSSPNIDFEKSSNDFDAIHLTAKGQSETHMSRPSLYGWDCESTLWFRWCFTDVKLIKNSTPTTINSL